MSQLRDTTHSDSVSTETAQAAPLPSTGFLSALVELGKLNIFELWLGVPLAWTLLDPQITFQTRTLVLLLLALVLKAATSSAALAMDDIAGMRDGVDLENHGDTDRYAVNKPLLDGRLSEGQALGFSAVGIATAILTLTAALVVAWPVPGWLVAFEIGVIFIAVNYSFWLKLSYKGGGDFVTVVAVGSTLLVPYAFITGTVSRAAVFQALLIGLWMLQVSVFSNTQDREGDRMCKRWTMAALTSERGNKVFICTVFASSVVVLVAGVVWDALSLWLALALAPVFVAQARQLWLGVLKERWLDARLLGFKVFRFAVAIMLVVNVVTR